MTTPNPVDIGKLVERPDKIEIANLDEYDAGLLGFGGGGDVDWWQDYIRAELGRAHDFYVAQHEDAIREAASALTALVKERDELKAKVEGTIAGRDFHIDNAAELLAHATALEAERDRLLRGIAEIMAGLVTGEVGGDDVVWFSQIETLWEYCHGLIAPDGVEIPQTGKVSEILASRQALGAEQ